MNNQPTTTMVATEKAKQQQQQKNQSTTSSSNGKKQTTTTTTGTTANPEAFIASIRKQIEQLMKTPAMIKDQSILVDLGHAVRDIDNYAGTVIKQLLFKRFGNCEWVVKVENYMKPSMSNSYHSRFTETKYVIKSISWMGGPSPQSVHAYLRETCPANLKTQEFRKEYYTRKIPDILKRITCTYKPYGMKSKHFNPIPIFIYQVKHKSSGKEVKQSYQVEVMDRALGIGTISDISVVEALMQLQTKLEDIFFKRVHNPAYIRGFERLQTYLVDYNNNNVNNNNNNNNSGAIVTASEAYEGKEPTGHGPSGPGQGSEDAGGDRIDTDETDVFSDNSIPPEEPIIEKDNAEPTPEEFIDHNFFNDQKPEFEKEADEESGGDGSEESIEEGEFTEEAPILGSTGESGNNSVIQALMDQEKTPITPYQKYI